MGGPLIASRWWQCISFDEDKLHLPAAVFAKPKPEPNTNDDDDQRTACLCFGGEDRPIAFASGIIQIGTAHLQSLVRRIDNAVQLLPRPRVRLRSSSSWVATTTDVGDDR